MEDALLGEDGADQNGNQQNDRHGLPSHALEMVDHRGEAEGPRAQRHPLKRDHQRPDHLRQQDKVVADRRHGPADAFQARDDGVRLRRLGRQFVGPGMDLFEQAAVVVAQADQSGLASLAGPGAHRAFQKPGAEGIEPVDPRHVDGDAAHGRIGAGGGVDLRLERARVLGRPRSGRGKIEAIAA